MSTYTEKNAFEYLLALYYNEDYFDEYGGIWEALDAFLDEDPASAPAVPSLIGESLRRYTDDEELTEYLRYTGCAYDTTLYPGGVRAWLTEIARRITQALETRPAGA